ncbi:MAG: hypothetical protein IJX81_00565 [Clostridia bacterium]|nr:hypothetical protein [Clostridia bacterium]
MRITDMISITELAKILGKSRPTVYKYISDFESGNEGAVPLSVRKLFQRIRSGDIPKRGIYEYCEHWFAPGGAAERSSGGGVTLKELVRLLKDNEKRLDFTKLKRYIEEELKNEK